MFSWKPFSKQDWYGMAGAMPWTVDPNRASARHRDDADEMAGAMPWTVDPKPGGRAAFAPETSPLIGHGTVDGHEAVFAFDAEGVGAYWYVDNREYNAYLGTAEGAGRWAALFTGATTLSALRAGGFAVEDEAEYLGMPDAEDA